jgi:polyisoprenoid-binding protein YceI
MTSLKKLVLLAALGCMAMLLTVRSITTLERVKAQNAGSSTTAPPARPQNSNSSAPAKPTKVSYLPIPAGDYRLDVAHSDIGFSILHNELALVRGRFKDFTGTIKYSDTDVTKSSVEFTAKVTSIDTGHEGRDRHLRTADFFEVEKFPEMTFKSTRVERKGKSYVLHGDLTLKGVTKPVALPFTMTGAIKDGRGNTRIGIAAQTKIDRRDFGITWGSPLPTGGVNVANEVLIDLQLEAMQPPPPKPAN